MYPIPQQDTQPRNAEQPSSGIADGKDVAQDKWLTNLLTAKRYEAEFGLLYPKIGKGFSEWWNEMDDKEKKRLLLDLTHASIPMKEVSPAEITAGLSGQGHMSKALYDYNVQSLTGPCTCDEQCNHYFNGKLLHEIADWASKPREKELENLALCKKQRNSGVFPDMYDGKVAFVNPSSEDDEISNAPYVFTDIAPASDVRRFKEYISRGIMHDASVFQYATSRKIHSLQLFLKLFDEYQVKVRRTIPANPMERLSGCVHCFRSCRGRHQNCVRSVRRLCFAARAAWLLLVIKCVL